MKTLRPLLIAAVVGAAPGLTAQDADDGTGAGRIFHSLVWTGKEAIVWGGGSEGKFFGHGFRLDPDAKTRRALATDGAPSARWTHAAVWTGSEMLVWGGRAEFASNSHRDDGARYDPNADRWRPITATNAPTARSQMAAVWTGDEMIVWGGYGDGGTAWDTGGRYDPKAGRWRMVALRGAPEARVEPIHVWTGTVMLVWGGITPDLKQTFRTGGRYNPKTDRWAPIRPDDNAPAVWGAPAVWTGTEMLIWGGSHQNGDENVNQDTCRGWAYNPSTDRWRSLSTTGAPAARFFHTAVWTGSRLVVWGGGDQGGDGNPARHFDDGGVYDPVADRWEALPRVGGLAGRGLHTAVWAGRGMVVYGGSTGGFSAFADAALWLPR
jgi:N-acetylneuraminic acid mutarotase